LLGKDSSKKGKYLTEKGRKLSAEKKNGVGGVGHCKKNKYPENRRWESVEGRKERKRPKDLRCAKAENNKDELGNFYPPERDRSSQPRRIEKRRRKTEGPTRFQ